MYIYIYVCEYVNVLTFHKHGLGQLFLQHLLNFLHAVVSVAIHHASKAIHKVTRSHLIHQPQRDQDDKRILFLI